MQNYFASNWSIVYYQMNLNCVFLDQKVKIVFSNRNWDGFFKYMAATKQHPIVEKRAGECMFLFFPLIHVLA